MNKWLARDWSWLLGVCFAFIFLLVAYSVAFPLSYFVLHGAIKGFDGWIKVAPVLAVSLGVMVAVWVQISKRRFDDSEVFLNRSVELVEKAYAILCLDDDSPTNNRVHWVTAARLIQRAISLSGKISIYAHQQLFESEHDYQRHKFHRLLSHKGAGLPPAFYLGVDDWKTFGFGDLALLSSSSKIIPLRIISVVEGFIRYPDEYVDPLDGAESLSDSQLDKNAIINGEGFKSYAVFLRRFTYIGERLFDAKTKSYPHSPALIDQFLREELNKFESDLILSRAKQRDFS